MDNCIKVRQTTLYILDAGAYFSTVESLRFYVEATLGEDEKGVPIYCYHLCDKQSGLKKPILRLPMIELDRTYGRQSTKNALSAALYELWIQSNKFISDLAEFN